jgi:hypothetical protein
MPKLISIPTNITLHAVDDKPVINASAYLSLKIISLVKKSCIED